MVRLVPALVMLLAASLTAAGLPIPISNDAGSGGDAPNSARSAYLLPGPGTYEGTLLPSGDADWYTLREPARVAGCIVANVTGPAFATAILALDPELTRNDTLPLSPTHGVELALATSSIEHAWLGFTPRAEARAEDASTGTYAFNISALTRTGLGPGDAGTGRDAGSDIADALAIQDGCIGGDLNATLGDIIDTYSFTGHAGQRISMSLAEATSRNVQLSLVRPDGTNFTSVTSDSAKEAQLDATGTWSLNVTLASGTQSSYVIALARDPGPEPDPCRPMCMIASPPG